jgi:hypothetical protein
MSRIKLRITFCISLPVDGASEIRGGVSVPVALVPGALRIRAERPLHLDSLGRVAADEFRRYDLIRRDAVLDPMRKRSENIVLGVKGGRRSGTMKSRANVFVLSSPPNLLMRPL